MPRDKGCRICVVADWHVLQLFFLHLCIYGNEFCEVVTIFFVVMIECWHDKFQVSVSQVCRHGDCS